MKLPDRRLNLAFFGTPEIAATVLTRLLDEGADDVVLAVSQPDRPKGRGKKLEPTPVHRVAAARGVPLAQPTKLKDGALAQRLRDLEVDLAVVVAYGRILPTDLFEAPRFDTWNVHASLLPRHRGAAPAQHAILEGDAQTGVTLMRISEGMDEGDMLLTRTLPLDGTETGGSLLEGLAEVGAEAAVQGIREAKEGRLTATPQDHAAATYAPMIAKADGALDLTQPADALERRIRAFQPWPTAFVATEGGPLKILAAAVVPADPEIAPGTVAATRPDLIVRTGDGALRIDRVQPPGKKPMDARAFLNGAGRHIEIGQPLGVR